MPKFTGVANSVSLSFFSIWSGDGTSALVFCTTFSIVVVSVVVVSVSSYNYAVVCGFYHLLVG